MGRHRPHFHHFAQADGVLWLLCRICGRGGMSRWHLGPERRKHRGGYLAPAVTGPLLPKVPAGPAPGAVAFDLGDNLPATVAEAEAAGQAWLAEHRGIVVHGPGGRR